MSSKRVPAHGPLDAEVMIVGEAPGVEEEQSGMPFVGMSGKELDRMLAEVGISRLRCRITNVTPFRPPSNDIEEFFYTKTEAKGRTTWNVGGRIFGDEIAVGLEELHAEITRIKPRMIIALGKTALWALTGQHAITSWRGSMLNITPDSPVNLMAKSPDVGGPSESVSGPSESVLLVGRVLPTYHPAAVLRQWAWRSTMVHDLRRAAQWIRHDDWPGSEYAFITSPSFEDASGALRAMLRAERPVVCDIETTGRNISLVGLASSPNEAICLPFFTNETPDKSYWAAEQEYEVTRLLRLLLESPQCGIIGQNFHYDSQHLLRSMGIYPFVIDDTMWMQHVLFPGQPKALDYLASMYCKRYVYWKDELKEYRKLPDDEQMFRRYNCQDVAYTYEIWQALSRLIDQSQMRGPYTFQMSLFAPVLDMMVRGIKVDYTARHNLTKRIGDRKSEIECRLEAMVGETVGCDPRKSSKWYRSPQQMCRLFYDEMNLPVVLNRKTKKPTTDWDALEKLKVRNKNPAFQLMCEDLQEYGTLDVYTSTFLADNLDPDGRARCSFNVAGAETMRFSSSENAFGSGMNLENLPRDKVLNVRSMFTPDPGYVILDFDLEQADLRVVVCEAECVFLQDLLEKGQDVYTTIAREYYNDSTITKQDDRRQIFKGVIHAFDYVAGSRTVSENFGLAFSEVERARRWYFAKCPEVPRWHNRVDTNLRSRRSVTNAYGYRRVYFDRLESVLTQATAWIAQSTVAVTINKGLRAIYDKAPFAQLLLQNHDSLVMQIPHDRCNEPTLNKLRDLLLIPIPYPTKPLIIPVGLKLSAESWGSLK